MDIETWISRVIGDDSRRTAAKKIDVNDSTISRQISRTHTLSPEVVIALCREYDYSPADGLVETGHLKPSEIEGAGVAEALGYATNEQILDEMMRRVDPQAVRLFQGDEDTITPSFDAKVHHFPTPGVQPLTDDEEAAIIEEANQYQGAAHPRTPRLDEPEDP